MTTTITIPCEILKQGGAWASGNAIARKGKQLLVRYRIQSGEWRERWFTPSRQREVQGDINTLPRYVARSCKAVTLDEPIVLGTATVKTTEPDSLGNQYDFPIYNDKTPEALQACPKCGHGRGDYRHGSHNAETRWRNIETGEIPERDHSFPWATERDHQTYRALPVEEKAKLASGWERILIGFGGIKLDDELIA